MTILSKERLSRPTRTTNLEGGGRGAHFRQLSVQPFANDTGDLELTPVLPSKYNFGRPDPVMPSSEPVNLEHGRLSLFRFIYHPSSCSFTKFTDGT